MINDEEMKNNPTDGTCVGTPIYMSPQVLLSEPYTIKCDVWSLGIVFYKILFNLYPWERTDNIQSLIERMKKDILFPPHIEVDDWLKDLIRGMMTIEEEERLSIKDVVQILKKYMETRMDMEPWNADK